MWLAQGQPEALGPGQLRCNCPFPCKGLFNREVNRGRVGAPQRPKEEEHPRATRSSLAQTPRSSISLEVWITKRQQLQNVLAHHKVHWAIFLFSNMGLPALALLAQGPLLTPGRAEVQRPGTGDSMRPRVIHRAIVEGGLGERASLPSVPRTRGR